MSEASKKQKVGRCVKSLITGKIVKISEQTPTPILHVESARAINLYIIDDKYITSKFLIISRFYKDLTYSQIRKWTQNNPSKAVSDTLMKCRVIDTRSLSIDQLNSLCIQYTWLGI
jgi:hypothetical protein